jgi:4-hydroxy-3-methylbut-2-enyl diphosphate reductase
VKIIRAEKYGFCAGVRIADKKVKKFVAEGGSDGQILGQVVHNERVVQEMEEMGVPTIDALGDAENGTIVFSAHGVPPSFHDNARSQGLQILDTTCPFVYDIHEEADKAVDAGSHLVFIGAPDHREVVGYTHDRDASTYHVLTTIEAAEQVDWSQYESVKILYQTTLNAEDYEDVASFIESRCAGAGRADTICYATKENQDSARVLGNDPEIDIILVIGGKWSANTRHLWEICRELKPSYLIQGALNIDPAWIEGVSAVGVTAGASTPDYVIDEVEEKIVEISGVDPASVERVRPGERLPAGRRLAAH